MKFFAFVCAALVLCCTVRSLTDEEKAEIVDGHNDARDKVTMDFPAHPPAGCINHVEWDDYLAETAQTYADTCPSGPSSGRTYIDGTYVGESMFSSTGYSNPVKTALSSWYEERKDFLYDSSTGTTGHYTQMVWNETIHIGCGVKKGCSGSFETIVVCHYHPGGNMNGQKPWDESRNLTDEEKEKFVDGHNEVRDKVPTDFPYNPPATPINHVEWDDYLADLAQAYADTVPTGHSPSQYRKYKDGTPAGENLYFTNDTSDPIQVALDTWYNESMVYRYDDEYGEYTQMVWNNSVRIGCGVKTSCSSSQAVVCCLYHPSGNIISEKPWIEAAPYLSDEQIKELVDGHNEARDKVPIDFPDNLPATPINHVEWDNYLGNLAQSFVDGCPTGHSPSTRRKYKDGSLVGENLFWTNATSDAIQAALGSWYNASKLYEYFESGGKGGHYTQMVWNKTVRIGCGVKTGCSNGFQTVICCNYHPCGNYYGQQPWIEVARSLTDEEKNIVVDMHNEIRDNVPVDFPSNAPTTCLNHVEWDDYLANMARDFVDTCPNRHSPYRKYRNCSPTGETLYFYNGTQDPIQGALSSWYNQRSKFVYDQSSPSDYTQMIWNGSTRIGCALKRGCEFSVQTVVCNYWPIGNYVGQKPWVQKADDEPAPLCPDSVTSFSRSDSSDEWNNLLPGENKCYEVFCEDAAVFKKRESAIEWESRTDGCVEYNCDNESGLIWWSKCNSNETVSRVCVNNECIENTIVENKAAEESKWIVKIELQEIKVVDFNISEVIADMKTLIIGFDDDDDVVAAVVIDENGIVKNVVFYLGREEIALKIEQTIKELDKGEDCEYGALCRVLSIEVQDGLKIEVSVGFQTKEITFVITSLMLIAFLFSS